MTDSQNDLVRTPRAGVVGLGMIGGGVAVSLAKSGHAPSAVFDVRADAAAALDGELTQVSSPAAVAQESDVVLVAVVNAAQAMEVLDGENGVLKGAHDGMVVVLLSTVSIEAVRSLAAVCESRGVAFLDAGVTGGSRASDNGLVVMVGGADDMVAYARPVLEGFAKAVVHCGPLGSGMVAKLARNSLTYSVWAAVREATALAEAGGLTRAQLLSVFEEGDDDGSSPYALLRAQVAGAQAPGDRSERAAEMAQKDLSAAQEFAGAAGVDLPLVNVIRPQMSAVFRGELDSGYPEDARAKGFTLMDRVYGDGFSAQISEGAIVPSIVDTIDHLFGEVWSRPYLTIRDRRLLVLGATSMLGRADLLETQLRGAVLNGELTVDQLREVAVLGNYYAGWGNGTVLNRVIEKLIAEDESGQTDA